MKLSQNDANRQVRVAPKGFYEKPKVTTFGSVAALTLKKTGSVSDGAGR